MNELKPSIARRVMFLSQYDFNINKYQNKYQTQIHYLWRNNWKHLQFTQLCIP